MEHGIHNVAQIVDDGLGRGVIGKIAGGSHVKHVVASLGFQSWHWEECLWSGRFRLCQGESDGNIEFPLEFCQLTLEYS